MGKIIEIKVGEYFFEKLSKPVRNKREIVLLLLETLKFFDHVEETKSFHAAKIIVVIDKMNRIFYYTKNKFFSIYFPFSLEKADGGYKIYDTLTDLEINNRMLSLLISLFKQEEIFDQSLEKAMDLIIECAEDYEYKEIDDIWRLLFRLWHMEEGYIRYDCDPVHENRKKHPLHHLDVNYSGSNTFKIGLNQGITLEQFRDILDIGTDCAYLSVVGK